MKNKLQIFYDGDCIYCKNYAKLSYLQKKFDQVEIKNIRDGGDEVLELKKKYNLNEGMIVVTSSNIYYGYLALWFLSTIHSKSKIINILFFPFRFKIISKIFYPLFKIIRSITLLFLGRQPIK
tara:strand:+ start:26384 stop:26752 length:369 start_codon:yes stop_codon:yes gene_type:complete